MTEPRIERAAKAEKPWSTRSEPRLWDDIVIGSGMGGLATAALLAEVGRRVLVLEQHYVPGGFTHTFKRKRWVWDVGVHAVGEVTDRAVLGRVLHKLSGDRLEWASLGGVYDEFHYPDLRIDFPDTKAKFEENLVEAFPSREEDIGRYFNKVREVAGGMMPYYASRIAPPSWAAVSDPLFAQRAHALLGEKTRDVMNKITSDERLQSVLTAQWGYYGVPPDRSSFAIHALVARHFFHGGYYPVGGAGRIAEDLLATVAKHGGWSRINADVQEIIVRDNAVRGVRLADGEIIEGRRVVSAAGAIATVERLLPASERDAPWAKSIASLAPSPCHVCLYLGFKGDITKAGASGANKWFYETWAKDASYWDIADENAKAPVLYCSFPSLKDPEHQAGPELLHTGEVVTFVPYELFEQWKDGRWRKRGEDYDALKKRLTDRMLDQFFAYMPELRPMLAFAELSTPISTEHFTRAPKGAIYGIEPTPERYANRYLRPRTPVEGLFLSGADMASVGVMGAFVGGLLCAAAMEPVAATKYLRAVAKR
ncbi:MAG: NAD(P)/FAD-dependent oxidoreductase [Myxococcales bacterium]|nr:NAD(P)/FAD-dependent oxidoreductase [Myxococcales bacterium]